MFKIFYIIILLILIATHLFFFNNINEDFCYNNTCNNKNLLPILEPQFNLR